MAGVLAVGARPSACATADGSGAQSCRRAGCGFLLHTREALAQGCFSVSPPLLTALSVDPLAGEPVDASDDQVDELGRCVEELSAGAECHWIGQVMCDDELHELEVLLAAGGELGNAKVMDLEAPPHRVAGIGSRERHQPVAPIGGSGRSGE